VKLSDISKRLRKIGLFAVVAGMLALWLGVCALEVSPELHHFLHKDAQSPTHTCLVTQLQKHSILSGLASPIALAAPAGWNPLAAQGQSQLFASFDYRLSPSRAPPRA